ASDRYSNNIVNKVCFSFDEACISTSSRSAFLDYMGGELVCRFLHNNNISSINGDPYAVYAAIPFERLSDTVIGYIVNICKGRVEKDEINASNYTLDFSVEGIIEPELIKLVRKI
ncbi:MAG: hypothetical protein IJT72_10260, partial [Lachnospiraceae bacterium]|nr:hypothetical protein [Lachnospiraceae bacterium]